MDSKVASPPLPPLFPLAGTAPPTPEDLARLYAELAEFRAANTRQAAALHTAELKIQALTLELAHHKRLRFGQQREALAAAGQRERFAETVAAAQAAREAELAQRTQTIRSKAPRKPRIRAGRQPLPPQLPRIEHRHEPESCQCGEGGRGLVKLGEDITEPLDVAPARFFVHRHIRPQYAGPHCETVTAVPVPPALSDGGMAATGLLVWVLIGQYLDHLPLYRLGQIAAREGVPLALSTLAEWVGRLGVARQPLADRLAEFQRLRPVLHADETPVRQLDPGGGKTKTAYLWAYRRNGLDAEPPIRLFDYQTSREGKHASAFLRGWQGHLMVDDYAGYKAVFRDGRITELGCMAHPRRKFFDLFKATGSPIAARALRHLGRLYRIEAQVAGWSPLARQRWRARHGLAAAPAVSRLAGQDPRHGARRNRHRQRHRPHPQPLAGPDPLCRNGAPAHRQ